MASTEVKLQFLSSLEHFWPDPWDSLSTTSLFFEKMHNVFKNKAQGCSTPLKRTVTKSPVPLNVWRLNSNLLAVYLNIYGKNIIQGNNNNKNVLWKQSK